MKETWPHIALMLTAALCGEKGPHPLVQMTIDRELATHTGHLHTAKYCATKLLRQ